MSENSRRASPPRAALAVVVAIGVLMMAVADARAHDTWLLAGAGNVKVGQAIRLRLTSGDAFPTDDFAIDPARVRRAVVRLAGRAQPLPTPATLPLALQFTWAPASAGIATFGVELAPKTLTLDPDKIEEYLAEIDATPAVRAQWNALGGKRRWIESYVKHAMAFVRVGDRGDSSWTRPMELGLEIVPERDPTAVRAGDTLVVRVLRGGAPLGGFAVGAVRERATRARFSRTDSAGRARIVFGAPGRWLLNGTDLRRSTDPALVWESDFVTMTLHVRQR